MVSKVYALLMRHFLPSSSAEKRELLTDVQDLEKKPERLQIRRNYGKDFSPWMVERSP